MAQLQQKLEAISGFGIWHYLSNLKQIMVLLLLPVVVVVAILVVVVVVLWPSLLVIAGN